MDRDDALEEREEVERRFSDQRVGARGRVEKRFKLIDRVERPWRGVTASLSPPAPAVTFGGEEDRERLNMFLWLRVWLDSVAADVTPPSEVGVNARWMSSGVTRIHPDEWPESSLDRGGGSMTVGGGL